MSKRKQRKEEEARILRELDEAVAAEKKQAEQGENAEKTTQSSAGEFIPAKEEVFHCKRCKTKLERGICPVCGYKMYQPMTEEQRKKIRRIVAIVCVGIFLVAFIALKLK